MLVVVSARRSWCRTPISIFIVSWIYGSGLLENETDSLDKAIRAAERQERASPMDLAAVHRGDDDLRAVSNEPPPVRPAVSHREDSARDQYVEPDDNLNFYQVIKEFKDLTG